MGLCSENRETLPEPVELVESGKRERGLISERPKKIPNGVYGFQKRRSKAQRGLRRLCVFARNKRFQMFQIQSQSIEAPLEATLGSSKKRRKLVETIEFKQLFNRFIRNQILLIDK